MIFMTTFRCMVYHGGNPAMLNILLSEKKKNSNKYIKSFLQELILDLTNGLQYTVRKGFEYNEEFLNELSCSLEDLNKIY